MMAGFGAVLLFSSLDTRSNIYDTNPNLRHSRKLAASNPEVSSQATTTSTTRYSPAIAAKVHELAAPMLADGANIFAFDKNDPRPVMNTFFAIREGLAAIKKDDAETLAIWKQAWSAAGWNPRVISMKDAEGHPEYEDIVNKLNNEVPLGHNPDYDRSCYLRHFAMAALGGGWMSDYDTVPISINATLYGRQLPNDGKFTTFEVGTPSLIVGNGNEWARVSNALLREGISANNDDTRGLQETGRPRLFSDMMALEALVEKKEVIVNEPKTVFQLREEWKIKATDILEWNFEPNPSLKAHCETMQSVMAVHISHQSIIDMFIHFLHARPLLMAEFLDRWSKLCGGPDFHFSDSAHRPTSTETLSLYDTDETMGISRENKLMYVHVPQTDGSVFEHSGLFSDTLSHHPIGGHRTIGEMNYLADKREVSGFIKAAFIRHPCERFIGAFELMTSDAANAGDKRWAEVHIGDKSIDDFVVEVEKNPEAFLPEAHFLPMWQWLVQPDGTYGINITMCYETWSDSLERLSNDYSIAVPDSLKTTDAPVKHQPKCQDLRPDTRAAIERIYQMDYCIFEYSNLPQDNCPQHYLSAEQMTQKYNACSAAAASQKGTKAKARIEELSVPEGLEPEPMPSITA